MSKESFKILKEINSLSESINEFTDKMNAENKRINFIKDNRQDREDLKSSNLELIKEASSKLTSVENEIAHITMKLEKDKENLAMISTEQAMNNMEKQIAAEQNRLEEFENTGFELMEQIEQLEAKVIEADEFLKGSLESLTEIQSEVELINKEHQSSIDGLNKRVNLLIEELPADFTDRYQRTVKSFKEKKKSGSIFSRIKNETCEFCRFGMSKMDVQKVEDALQLKNCQGCGRIFIPQGALY